MLKFTLVFIALSLLALLLMSLWHRPTRLRPPEQRTIQPCPGTPNCVSSLAEDETHRIQPLPLLDGDPGTSWQRLKQLIRAAGGEIVFDDGRYLHAVFETRWLRFRDDLEAVRGVDRIDIRSASRAGRSDFEVNRNRVERLRRRYLAE